MSTDVSDGLITQSARESIPYTIDTSSDPYGGSPASIAPRVVDLLTGDDVSADVLLGSATTADDVIVLPELYGLTAGRRYRLSVAFRAGGATWAPFWIVEATP